MCDFPLTFRMLCMQNIQALFTYHITVHGDLGIGSNLEKAGSEPFILHSQPSYSAVLKCRHIKARWLFREIAFGFFSYWGWGHILRNGSSSSTPPWNATSREATHASLLSLASTSPIKGSKERLIC